MGEPSRKYAQAKQDQPHPASHLVLGRADDGVHLRLPGADMVMTAATLEELIAELGKIRASMSPEVPRSIWGTNAKVFALETLFISDLDAQNHDALQHGALLVGRSPEYGWAQFVARPEACRGLLAWLSGERQELGIQAPTAFAH